jgi:hypothetical protein
MLARATAEAELAVTREYIRTVPPISGYSRELQQLLSRKMLLLTVAQGETVHAWENTAAVDPADSTVSTCSYVSSVSVCCQFYWLVSVSGAILLAVTVVAVAVAVAAQQLRM